MMRERALGLRYSAPVESSCGKISYHVVFERGSYDLESLSAKARRDVRSGLKQCEVSNICMERLAKHGWRLQEDTLERQGRSGSLSQGGWELICMAAMDLPGFEGWGVTVGGELAAAALTARVDDTCYILYQMSDRRYFRAYVNNALTYVASRKLLERPGVRTVFYGLHSLDAPASVDKFKFRMDYVAKPVRQRVSVHPWLSPGVNKVTQTVAAWLRNWLPQSRTIAKAEGILRFHLEGNRPPGEQNWPEGLAHRKLEILQSLEVET